MAKEFKLPDLGEGVESGDVVTILVSPGDTIELEQGVIELETDKALIEVPSEVAGTVVSIEVNEGDSVAPGQVIITVDEAVSGASETPVEKTEPARAPEPKPAVVAAEPEPEVEKAAPAPQPAASKSDNGPIPAAPATRRYARELGVDLAGVAGSGPGGRIVQEDVQKYVKGAIAGGAAAGGVSLAQAGPLPDFSKWGEVERQPLPKIRQVIARNLSVSWNTIPHVTQFGSADVTDLEAFRQRNKAAAEAAGAKLTPTVLVLKAIITALKAFPQFNASLDAAADELIIKHYYNLGIAVDTERGLMVPVIPDVDRKDIFELAIEMADLGERTRTNKVSLDELQGGTFSVTNLGSLGGSFFTPIVNHPEVAILGIGRGAEQAAVRNGRIEARMIMPLCLSYDHRVIDGADGVRFVNQIINSLENPEAMLLGG